MTENLIHFTCEKIILKNGKKKPVGLPDSWNTKINETNYTHFIKPNHKVKCILTGKRNDITVFDFDTNEVYFETIAKHPQLKQCHTIKTNKGFHVYTKYNPKYKTTTNKIKNIDIRNDGGMVFGNGTKTEFNTEYTIYNHGTLNIEAPQELYDFVKTKKIKQKLTLKQPNNNNLKNEEPIHVIRNNLNNDLLNNINLEFWKNRNDWIKLVWAMRKLGYNYETIKCFSKKAHNEYTDEGLKNVYNSFTTKKECGLGTIKYYSRISDETKYINIIAQYSTYINGDDDYAIAKQFLNLNEGQLFLDTQRNCWYIYRNKRWLRDDSGHSITVFMYEDMKDFIDDMIIKAKLKTKKDTESDCDDDEEDTKKKINNKAILKNLSKIKKKIVSGSSSKTIFNILRGHVDIQINKIPFDINQEQKFNIHFKNCCFEYKTKTTRERTKEDLISYTLDYNYDPKCYGEPETKWIENFFKKIEPNVSRREMLLSYLSLSLTGETKHQKFLVVVGKKASNGKSTIFKIMAKCFPIYVEKLDKSAFLKSGEQTRHKLLASLIDKPIRLGFVEELDDKGLDGAFLKDFTDNNGTIKIKILYGTEVSLTNQAKLAFASNSTPNLQIDNGTKRRLIVQNLESQFLDVENDDWENQIFTKDDDLLDIFNDDKWKVCLFDYLMKFQTFKIPDEINEMTEKVVSELDIVKQIILSNYIVTNNDDDDVYKTELEHFITHSQEIKTNKIKEKDIKEKLKNYFKLIYDKGKLNKIRSRKRGAWIGIREKNEEDEDDEYEPI